MKISYVYHLDAARQTVQSGRPASVLREFRAAGVDVQEVFPLEHRFRAARWGQKLLWHSLGQQYLFDRHPGLLRDFARQIERRLEESQGDVVFSPSTLPITYLRTKLPVTFCADSCFAAMLNYYGAYSKLSAVQTRYAEHAEQRILSRTALAVYPSEWAANAAIRHYGLPADRVAVIPFGANFGKENELPQVSDWIEQRDLRTVRLLFAGREWDRKGGDIVIETARLLIQRGLNVELHVVGSDIPAEHGHLDFIRPHGRLDYSTSAGLEGLEKLFRESTLLFMPSRAEAFGMVYCEGNAFGLPCIATATGGITGIIRDGVNGYAPPVEAGPAEYAEIIARVVGDTDQYRALALSSFDEFHQRLNWKTFTRRYLSLVEERVLRTRRPATSAAAISTKRETLRLGYVSILPSDDVHAWSGLNYNIARSLRSQGVEVIPIGPLHSRWRTFLSKVRAGILGLLTRKRYLWSRDTTLLRYYARTAARLIEEADCDVIFSPGTEPIAYLPEDIGLPIVFWTDAPFGGVLGYYAWYQNLAPACTLEATQCDNIALQRALFGIYSSAWAAKRALDYHKAPSDTVKVVPFGANLASSLDAATVASLTESRLSKPWRFLFVGVDWERKGADIVLAVLTELNRRGYPCELVIVGCTPPQRVQPLPSFVSVEGFINKRTAEGCARMADLYRSTTFFFMPSRAEAYGIVFCEASAHGVPSLTTDTGGIPTIIRDGYNGRLFPLETSIEDYVSAILAAVEPTAYRQFCANAVHAYEENLNWKSSSRRVIALIERALGREAKAPAQTEVLEPASAAPISP